MTSHLSGQRRALLLIGHGRLYDPPYVMRCSPMPQDELQELMSECDVTSVDDCPDVMPGVIADVKSEGWHRLLQPRRRFDFVVEAISPLASNVRSKRAYWEGVHRLMAEEGAAYVGWADDARLARQRRTMRTDRAGVARIRDDTPVAVLTK